MFGILYNKNRSTACYIGVIADIENIDTDKKRMLISIDDVVKQAMDEDFWCYDAKVNFLHYGYKEFQLLEKRYWQNF